MSLFKKWTCVVMVIFVGWAMRTCCFHAGGRSDGILKRSSVGRSGGLHAESDAAHKYAAHQIMPLHPLRMTSILPQSWP